MKLPKETALIGLAALAGLGLIWWATRPGVASQMASNFVSGVADTVGEIGTGAVIGIGKIVGIPETNLTQCERDLAAGNYWDASFSCPASDFLGGVYDAGKTSVFGSTGLSAAAAQDARNVFAANDPRRVDLPRQPTTSWKLWES